MPGRYRVHPAVWPRGWKEFTTEFTENTEKGLEGKEGKEVKERGGIEEIKETSSTSFPPISPSVSSVSPVVEKGMEEPVMDFEALVEAAAARVLALLRRSL